MAQPATILIQSMMKPDVTRRKKYLMYRFLLGDPGVPTYPAGGIVVDLTTVKNMGGWERGVWSEPRLPTNEDITQEVLPSGYSVTLQQAAAAPTMKNFVLRIWTAPGTELGTGSNIPAGLFAALAANAPTIDFRIRGGNYY